MSASRGASFQLAMMKSSKSSVTNSHSKLEACSTEGDAHRPLETPAEALSYNRCCKIQPDRKSFPRRDLYLWPTSISRCFFLVMTWKGLGAIFEFLRGQRK